MAIQGKNMARIMLRGNKLYLDYRVHGKRVQRSTGLNDTPQNRKILENEVLPELILRIKTGDLKKPDEKLFSYYYKKFLVTKENFRGYEARKTQFEKVNTYFGKMKVSSITRLMVKDYISNLDMKNYSKAPYLNCISGVLEMALDDEIIDKNVASGIRLGKSERKEADPFSPDEVNIILDNATGMLKNYLGIAFNTGMRPSEILGLQHQDITDTTIKIVRSVTLGNVNKTKNKSSKREIPILKGARPYIDAQKKISKSFFLFEKDGDHLYGANALRIEFTELLKSCNIRHRTLYNTRHTFATQMLNSGAFKILDISAFLGHTNAQMLLTTYAGYIKGNHLNIDENFSLFSDKCVTLKNKNAL